MRAVCMLGGVLSVSLTITSPITVGARQAKPEPSTGAQTPTAATELLWWLPPDTETVVVTQTPATLRTGPLFEIMRLAEINVGDTTFSTGAKRQLHGFSVKASVEGSRRFLPPSGLGAMRYEGATLFVLDKPLGSSGSAVMSELKKGAEDVMSVEGLEVVQRREKLENDIWTSYITIARPDILIVATDRQYLAQVLRRRVTKEGPRALPAGLPEWRWVDTNAPYWALRHYRRDHIDEDPSSPFVQGGAAGVFDDGAVGVTAYATADGRTVVAHYLSTSGTADAAANRMWKHPDDGVDAAVRRVGDAVIEVRFTARDSDQMRMFFFYLFAALGHAIYV